MRKNLFPNSEVGSEFSSHQIELASSAKEKIDVYPSELFSA